MTCPEIKESFDAVDASRDEYEKCQSKLSCAHFIEVGPANYRIRLFPTYHHGAFLSTDEPFTLRRDYVPELARVQAVKEESLAAKKAESMRRMIMGDLKVDLVQNHAAFDNGR